MWAHSFVTASIVGVASIIIKSKNNQVMEKIKEKANQIGQSNLFKNIKKISLEVFIHLFVGSLVLVAIQNLLLGQAI